MTFDSLVFDLDGTLWDTLSGCTKAWKQALEEENEDGSSISEELLQTAMGLTPQDFFKKILPTFSLSRASQIGKRAVELESVWIRKGFFKFYSNPTTFFQSFVDKHSLFLLSNCEKPYLNLFVELSRAQSFLVEASCYENPKKSKAENILYLKEKYRLNRMLYIGDTETDRLACEKAEVEFCFASYGFGRITKPSHFKIETLTQLPKLLASIT